MSRGPGQVQRRALLILSENPLLDARGVAALIFGGGDTLRLTPSQYSSVRRALSTLKLRRLVVDLGNFCTGLRHSYCAREEAFWILHEIYFSGGGAKAFWPNERVALFYWIELRRRRQEYNEQLRRLTLHKWRRDTGHAAAARWIRRTNA